MNEVLRMKTRWLLASVLSFALFWGNAAAQTRTVTGTVTDGANGDPIPGVSVLVKGTTTGTITDVDGNYTITPFSDTDVLVFSFVGYEKAEVPVGSQTSINVPLKADLTTLDEVVVVGYGVQKKSVVTGAIAKVSAEDLKTSKDLRIEQAMQGRTAGVIIMNENGQPGSNLTIRIRGTGTNGNNDPLFLVDGLPMDKQGLNYLSPSDIESLEVLKDAASAAIYGTRGANGVVIITTKKGKKGEKFSVNYDGYYGVQNPWKKPDLLSSQQYMDIINEAALNDGRGPYFTSQMMDSIDYNTDWLDLMLYKNAPRMSHTVSFSGGSDKSTVSSSINFYEQDGIAAKGKSNFQRITYKLNTSFDLHERLTLGSNINLANIKTRGIDGNTVGGLGFIQGMNIPPIVPVRLWNGEYAVPNDYGIGLQEISNPIAMLEYTNRTAVTNKVIGNIYADVKLIEGLVFRTNFGGEVAYVKDASYTPKYDLDPNHYTLTNSAYKAFHQYNRWNWDNTITYSKSIDKHNFSVLAGITAFREWNERLEASADSLLFEGLDFAYLNNSFESEYNRPGNSFGEHTLQSYFGRVNYNFDEKYLFEAVLRSDGSSRFGRNNKYGIFPAASLGWVASKENFFPQNDIIDFAKVRASWGRNGNERIADFGYTPTMGRMYYFFGTGGTRVVGQQPSRYPNPDLKWETSEQLNIGLDLTFLSGKIAVTADWYDKRTKDWLIQGAPLPLLIGNVGPIYNAGEVKNSGVELELGYLNTLSNGLNLDIKLTGSTNRSEVVSLNTPSGAFSGGQGAIGQNDIVRAEVGKPLGYFWGFKTNGLFQSEDELEQYPHQPNAQLGDFKFVDINGDSTLDDKDRTNIGSPYPKVILGLNATLEFKGFDLNFFLYSAIGQDIFQANRRSDVIYANYTTEVLDRWYAPGTSNEIPRVTLTDLNQSWKRPSDFYVKDADYIRLRNVTLGYSLPSALIQKTGLTRLRIYATAENLLTLTKYDGTTAEVGGGAMDLGIDHGVYPEARSFIGGINLTF